MKHFFILSGVCIICVRPSERPPTGRLNSSQQLASCNNPPVPSFPRGRSDSHFSPPPPNGRTKRRLASILFLLPPSPLPICVKELGQEKSTTTIQYINWQHMALFYSIFFKKNVAAKKALNIAVCWQISTIPPHPRHRLRSLSCEYALRGTYVLGMEVAWLERGGWRWS